MKRFGLIGAAGYVAPRHMRAVTETGNKLVAALDTCDSVGVIDSYGPDADFFVEFERFDRHVDLLRRQGEAIDYMSVCSPNYLHDSHIRFALRSGANAICEKPLVLNPHNLDRLAEIERQSDNSISTILQLRLHPAVIGLKDRVAKGDGRTKADVDLTYITSRGRWYQFSWKGDEKKSGGIATNIGVHFFDMLHFVFGDLQESVVHHMDEQNAAGFLEYENARVRWFLSIDRNMLPTSAVEQGSGTFRNITIAEREVDFSAGFTDLHTRSYEEILKGNGFSVEDNRVAIETVASMRNAKPARRRGECHPFVLRL